MLQDVKNEFTVNSVIHMLPRGTGQIKITGNLKLGLVKLHIKLKVLLSRIQCCKSDTKRFVLIKFARFKIVIDMLFKSSGMVDIFCTITVDGITNFAHSY